MSLKNRNMLLVTLLVRKGKKGVEGDNITEKLNVKIYYGTISAKKLKESTIEWRNYINNCKALGAYTLDIVDVRENVDGELKLIETPAFIQEQVKQAILGSEKDLTPEQKELKEIKDKLDNALDIIAKLQGKVDSKEDTNSDEEKPTLKQARAIYEEAFGKKAHHLKGVDSILEEIKNK